MSGGHYNYVFCKVADMAMTVRNEASEIRNWDTVEPRNRNERVDRKKIAKWLDKVSVVMRALEWCDSGDTSWEETRSKFVELGVLDERW